MYKHDAYCILEHIDWRLNVHFQILWDPAIHLVQCRSLITALAHKASSLLGLIHTIITKEMATAGKGEAKIGLYHLQTAIG